MACSPPRLHSTAGQAQQDSSPSKQARNQAILKLFKWVVSTTLVAGHTRVCQPSIVCWTAACLVSGDALVMKANVKCIYCDSAVLLRSQHAASQVPHMQVCWQGRGGFKVCKVACMVAQHPCCATEIRPIAMSTPSSKQAIDECGWY